MSNKTMGDIDFSPIGPDDNEEIEAIDTDLDDDTDDTADGDGDDDEPEGDDDDDQDDGDVDDDQDDEDDDDDDQDDDEDIGAGAQKRIRKLNAQKKEALAQVTRLKKQLEGMKRLTGDDGKAIMAAASSTGILPQLMTRSEAEAFKMLENLPVVIESYEDWLEDNERDAEFDAGDGQTMSYSDVKKRVRKLKQRREELEEEYGEKRKLLKGKVRRILQLGLEAYRNGGSKQKKARKEEPAKKKRSQSPDDYPRGKKPRSAGGKKKVRNYGDVESTEELVRMFAKE